MCEQAENDVSGGESGGGTGAAVFKGSVHAGAQREQPRREPPALLIIKEGEVITRVCHASPRLKTPSTRSSRASAYAYMWRAEVLWRTASSP